MLIVAVLLILLNPRIQKYALEKSAAGSLDGSFEVGRVQVGTNRFEVEDFRLAKDGIRVSAEKVVADFSILDLLLRKRIHIAKVRASGLVLDLSEGAPDRFSSMTKTGNLSTSEKEESFRGLLPLEGIGYEVWIDALDISAEILLRGNRRVSLMVEGGGIRPDELGGLKISGRIEDEKVSSPRVDFSGELQLRLDSASEPREVRFSTVLNSKYPGIESPPSLRLDLQIAKTESGEGYKLEVSGIDSLGKVEERLVFLEMDYERSSGNVRGDYLLRLGTDELAPFAVGYKLPEFVASGEGSIDFSLDRMEGEFESGLELEASRLDLLDRRLSGLGFLKLNSQFAISVKEDVASLRRLNGCITDGNEQTLMTLEMLGPVEVDYSEGGFTVVDSRGELALVEFSGFPLSLLAPVFADSGLEFQGDSLSARLRLASGEGGLQMRADLPVQFEGVSIGREGSPLVRDLSGSFLPVVEYGEGSLRIELGSTAISSGGVELLSGDLVVTTPISRRGDSVLQARGELWAHLGGLSRQPFATDFREFLPHGEISIGANFEFKIEEERLMLSSTRLTVEKREGGRVLSVDLLQPLGCSLTEMEADLAEISGQLLSINLSAFPAEWIERFMPGIRIAGGSITGESAIFVVEEEFECRIGEKLSIEDLSAGWEDRELLQHASLTASPKIALRRDGAELEWKDLTLFSDGRVALTSEGSAELDFEMDPAMKRVTASFQINLPRLLEQPLISPYGNIEAGLMAVQANLDLTQGLSLSGGTAIRDLRVANAEGRTIEEANVEFELDWNQSIGKVTASATVKLKSKGGASDFEIESEMETTDGAREVSVSLKGGRVVMEDLLGLIQAYSTRQESDSGAVAVTASEAESREQVRDTVPFWAGYRGTVGVDLAELTHSRYGVFRSLSTGLRIESERLRFEEFESVLNGSPLRVSGDLGFESGRAWPYTLAAELSLLELDVGEFLRRANPRTLPVIEGVFNLTGAAHGEAENFDRLLETVRGDFNLTSTRGGVFRALTAGGGRAEAGAAIFGLAGAVFGDRVSELDRLSRITSYLRKIPYDTLTVTVTVTMTREPDLDLVMPVFVVQGPEVLVYGNGVVSYREGISILDQPLLVKGQIGAKERAAHLLNEIGQLRDLRNADDYYAGPAFAMKGSLREPDTSDLSRLLRQAALGVVGFGRDPIALESEDEETGEARQREEEAPSSNLQEEEQEPTAGEVILKSIFDLFGEE